MRGVFLRSRRKAAVFLFLFENFDSRGQARDFARGIFLVEQALGCRFVDRGLRCFQGFLCGLLVAGLDGFFDFADVAAHVGDARFVIACMACVAADAFLG